MNTLTVVGGGLAGAEAAWQAALRGVSVKLFEMRPAISTGAHETGYLAELVCSNSLGSRMADRASGLLKEELRLLGSLLVELAEQWAVPAGNSLSVDRTAFAATVTAHLENHPNIQIIREEAREVPDGYVILASGPLTSASLAQDIIRLTGQQNLFFFDAIAPVVMANSINMQVAFRASRYGKGDLEEGDYINCPLNPEEYEEFRVALLQAERIALRPFEACIEEGVTAGSAQFFEGCLPVEVLARRGRDALAFGPMRPVGLRDPRTGRRPYAVVQLRQDNLAGSLYNLVGFQTNLLFSEQKRIFRKIPGLEEAEFARYGQMHRNTYIASPELLHPTLQYRHNDRLLFAGQITGIEGYMGNIAAGFLAGLNAARLIAEQPALALPKTTMIGALCSYITQASLADFQPMKANFGILPALPRLFKQKRERNQAYAARAIADLEHFIHVNSITHI